MRMKSHQNRMEPPDVRILYAFTGRVKVNSQFPCVLSARVGSWFEAASFQCADQQCPDDVSKCEDCLSPQLAANGCGPNIVSDVRHKMSWTRMRSVDPRAISHSVNIHGVYDVQLTM